MHGCHPRGQSFIRAGLTAKTCANSRECLCLQHLWWRVIFYGIQVREQRSQEELRAIYEGRAQSAERVATMPAVDIGQPPMLNDAKSVRAPELLERGRCVTLCLFVW